METKEEIQLLKTRHSAYFYNMYVATIVGVAFVLFIIKFFGISLDTSIGMTFGIMVFIFAIMAHVQDHKLKLKSVGSILIYVANGVDIIAAIALIVGAEEHSGAAMLVSNLMLIIEAILKIIAGVFAFLLARKIKKSYPTIEQDYKRLRKEHKL